MTAISKTCKRKRLFCKNRIKDPVMGTQRNFLSRINKSLYYGKLPRTERFSMPVTELAADLFTEVKKGWSLDRLSLEDAADISRNACVSPCSLVLALIYLDRLKSCNPEYLIKASPTELFLVSLMIGSKFLNDDGEEDEVFNEDWAASAGIDVGEINSYEKDFLTAIGWEVFVRDDLFWSRLKKLEKDVALREGLKRGWFSYSDLQSLLNHSELSIVAQALLTVSAVCLASYVASVLTLIGSAFLVSQIPGSSLSTSSSSISSAPNAEVAPEIISRTKNSSQDLLYSSKIEENLILSSINSIPLHNCSFTVLQNSSHQKYVIDFNYLSRLCDSSNYSTFDLINSTSALHHKENVWWGDEFIKWLLHKMVATPFWKKEGNAYTLCVLENKNDKWVIQWLTFIRTWMRSTVTYIVPETKIDVANY